jgi:hypothetical protein
LPFLACRSRCIKSQIIQQKGARHGAFSASKEDLANSVGLSAWAILGLLKKGMESAHFSVKEADYS